MKKILFAISAVIAMTTACKKAEIHSSSTANVGTVSISLTKEANAAYIVTKATLDDIDVNTFTVNIKSNDGGTYNESWTYSDMPGTLELVSGGYTVSASSPNVQAVAWEQPIFGGSTNFAVQVGALSPVSLTCSIQNMKVTMNPSANFTNELSSYTIVVSSSDGSLTWTKEEVEAGKAGYFNVAPLTVTVNGTRHNGQAAPEKILNINTVNAKDHHIINLDANVTGDVSVTLKVDGSVNEVNQDVTIDGFDEIPVASGDNN